MALSNSVKIVIILFLIAIVWYLLSNSTNSTKSSSEESEGFDPNSNSNSNNENGVLISNDNDSMLENDAKLIKKMVGYNSTVGKKPNISSYDDGQRYQELNDIESAFMQQNPFQSTDHFVGINEGDNLAPFVSNKNVKQMTDEDKFNPSELLPAQTGPSDWFDDIDQIDVKNAHLLNIYRPVGVNTIGTTHKNPTTDIRGDIPNPKTIVSPFLNSSYDPDMYNKGVCGNH